MTLSTQFMSMIVMIALGSYFGAALDTYNHFLKRSKRNRWIVFMNDVLFWFLQGFIIFYTLFHVNYGELRFYLFLALLCGFAAYQSLFKNVYLKTLKEVIRFIVTVFQLVRKIFLLLIYKPILSLVMACVFLVKIGGQGLLALVKICIQVLSWMMTILFMPFRLIWKIVPRNVTKLFEKYFGYIAGYLKKIKKCMDRILKR